MDITIYPGLLRGTVNIIPSKSQAHRYLICAAFADGLTELICPDTNQDIEATADCLRALGALIRRTSDGYIVEPITAFPRKAELHCRESGSTLRFMLPVVGALGVNAVFHLEGRLPYRPLSPLWEEMERMGCILARPTEHTISCRGRLRAGNYIIAGNISSQFISGLLFALPLIHGESRLQITGRIESAPYIDMTKKALSAFGVCVDRSCISDSYPFRSPGRLFVEGDWSNGAFFLAASALGSQLDICGLDPDSCQGDKAVAKLLPELIQTCTIDASDIPDLVPILSVVAAATNGAKFTNIRRLRIKESDRVASVASMLQRLGAEVRTDENEMEVFPAAFFGCTVDAAGDHRIAMSAAIAATVARGPVTIIGAECVEKSYPIFWDVYRQLGGRYEQYLR